MPQATHTLSTKRTTIPLPRALPKSARMKVENAIEQHLSAVDALTAFLDEADGDMDLEPSADSEPWLGWSLAGACGNGDDRERDDADRESNFGWSERIDQTGLLNGSSWESAVR